MDNVITITSAVAGAGKTTVATNLSAILQARGHNTCLLDLSPNRGATLYHFPKAGPGKSIICWTDIEDYARAVSELVITGLEGIHIVPGPALPEQMSLITPTLAEQIINTLSKHHDAVVIDLGNPYQYENILTAGKTILASTPDAPSLIMTKKLYTKDRLLLINKYRLGQGGKVKKILGTKPDGYIPDRTDLVENALRQRPRAFPFSSKYHQKRFDRLMPGHLRGNRNTPKSRIKKRRRNPEPIIVYSSNQVISEARSATRPLVVVDANHINPSLAIALGVPTEKAWKHDWRAGLTASPFQLEKGFDVYTLDPEDTEFDDRNEELLELLIEDLKIKYRTVIINLPHEKTKARSMPNPPVLTRGNTVANAEKPTAKTKIPDHPRVAIIASKPEIIITHIYESPMKAKVTLIDCDGGLATLLNIPPEDIWKHDWRIGRMAEPARINKMVLFYGMQNGTIEDRDIRCLHEVLINQKKRQVILYLGQNKKLLMHLESFKILDLRE